MLNFQSPHASNASQVRSVDAAKQFTLPVLRENKNEWYIEFYAFDPSQGKLRRKRIKVNRIPKLRDRRKYAGEIIKRLTEQLIHGWNPWIAHLSGAELYSFAEVCTAYENYITKMFHDGCYRPETYAGYKSYLKNVREYNDLRRLPVYYIYQFDKRFCTDLLDHVFIERGNCAQTRNNYLGFLRTFSSFCVARGFLQTKPTEGIQPISKRLIRKGRTVIPAETVRRISEYLRREDPHFGLVCHLLYYCYLRPVEMTRLRLSCFNVRECTMTIPGEASKNRRTQVITLPKKVLFYAVDLGIFGCPQDYYLLSDGLRPGKTPTTTKIMRDHWQRMRKALGLRKEWKLYSLKDTGISEMLANNTASISVRDQARHSSIAITEIYAQSVRKTADKAILDIDGSL